MSTIVKPPGPRRSPAVEPLEIFEARIRAQHKDLAEGPRPIGEILDRVYDRIGRRRAAWLRSIGPD